jgi:hypothetical protein
MPIRSGKTTSARGSGQATRNAIALTNLPSPFRVAGTPLGRALIDNRGRQMHAAGTLSIDRWQGEERVQMRLTDVAVS